MGDKRESAGSYILIGKRRLGLEFIIIWFSYIGTFLLGHWVTALPGLERAVFYVVGGYNVIMFFAIALADPGWLSQEQKNKVNNLVSDLICGHHFKV